MSISYKYRKASADDITQIVRRQTYKVWDYGDTVIYGTPGGKMTTYHYIERGEDGEVLEPAVIGWVPPAAPAFVYETEVGITKNPSVVIIGEYVRKKVEASTPLITVAPVRQQQQRLPKNPKHTSQFKKQVAPAQHSIALIVPKEPSNHLRKKVAPKIPLMSIPLSG
jgi:hypothetical protein